MLAMPREVVNIAKTSDLNRVRSCGGKAKYESTINVIPLIDENGAYVDYDRIDYWERVYCTECGAEINSISEDEEEEITIKKWNRRTKNVT